MNILGTSLQTWNPVSVKGRNVCGGCAKLSCVDILVPLIGRGWCDGAPLGAPWGHLLRQQAVRADIITSCQAVPAPS
jgi:hypothetical protein